MSNTDSAIILQNLQALFNYLEINDRGNSLSYSEFELREFERQTDIILPLGYKEFCQVFSAGMFGSFVEIMGLSYLTDSKQIIANYKQALEQELEWKKKSRTRMDSF